MTSTQDGACEQVEPTGPGSFMLTLCRLASDITVRQPQAPALKRFKFFTSRVRQSDGSERLYLHMGHFATLTEARSWAQRMRPRYPAVIATAVPPALSRPLESGSAKPPDPFQQHLDRLLGADCATTASVPLPPPEPVISSNGGSPMARAPTARRDQTAELLSASEIWTDDDLAETVPHLIFESPKRPR